MQNLILNPTYNWYMKSGKKQQLFGQKLIRCKLEQLAKNPSPILLVGRSGLGKTTLAMFYITLLCKESKCKNYINFIPDSQNQEIDLSKISKDTIIFIDECHLIKDPEWLYKALDSKSHQIILATNQFGDLKAPLLNGRLILLELEEYTTEDLYLMIKDSLKDELKDLSYENCLKIIKAGKENPRNIVHSIVKQLNIFLPSIPEDFDKVLEYLGYDKFGLSAHERIYIKALNSLGGTAGLNRISAISGLELSTITKFIEPGLCKLGYIELAGRGRSLIYENLPYKF